MINKENKKYQAITQKLAQLKKQHPKSSQRYNLKQIDQNFDSINISPNLEPCKNKQPSHFSYSQNNKQYLSYKRSQFALSMKQKFKNMHLNSVHELISSVRQKISEIQDLTNKQESKAEYEDLKQNQISASLRKLRKVVRLMEIVCKIIIGTNQQNCYLDISSQHQMSLRDIHKLSIESFNKQLQVKDKQIQKLKKLVNILSIPQKQSSIPSNKSISDVNNQQLVKNSFQNLSSNVYFKQQQKILVNSSTQTQFTQLLIKQRNFCQEKVKGDNILCQKLQNLQNKKNKFNIIEEYCIWNILDATKNKQQQQQKQNNLKLHVSENKQQVQNSTRIFNERSLNQTQIKSNQIYTQTENQEQEKVSKFQSNYTQTHELQILTSRKFGLHVVPQVRVQPNSNFLKRYKSIVKIAVNGLNLCNNIFLKVYQNNETYQIRNLIQSLSQYFNNHYHSNPTKFDQDLCKYTREKLTQIYDQIYQIYNDCKIDQSFFQSIF